MLDEWQTVYTLIRRRICVYTVGLGLSVGIETVLQYKINMQQAWKPY